MPLRLHSSSKFPRPLTSTATPPHHALPSRAPGCQCTPEAARPLPTPGLGLELTSGCGGVCAVSYTHLRAHETEADL
eukprot:3491481-Rhodomonas_salina.1